MEPGFVVRAFEALCIVAVVLLGLAYLAKSVQRGRVVASTGKRLVTTVESTALAQNVAVHVVRVGGKYFLVGGGSAGVSMLSELAAEEIEPYIAEQRAALIAQRETLLRPFARFRKS